MYDLIRPAGIEQSDSGEPVVDKTSTNNLAFYHGNTAKPLSTPWQVSLERAKKLITYELPEGYIVDCACGSGVQLAAYASLARKPAVGIELDASRALASAKNLAVVSNLRKNLDHKWFKDSIFLVGDGTKGREALHTIHEQNEQETELKVGLLILDPARPRNSRTHGLEEMSPQLPEVFSGWKDFLTHGKNGPAIILDLSPRLIHEQRLEVESIVDEYWPGIAKTWEWVSRGGGRVDRLTLWLGAVADQNFKRRFVRIPYNPKNKPTVIQAEKPLSAGENIPSVSRRLPRKGDFLSIIDSALVESGLAQEWLESCLDDDALSKITDPDHAKPYWSDVRTRRPLFHHPVELKLPYGGENFIQAGGKIVAIFHEEFSLENSDKIVAFARKHEIGELKIRLPIDPSIQPKLQGAIDRQLSSSGGKRKGFMVKSGSDSMSLLVV